MSLNYINQFVQLLKISNHQLSQATNTKFITQSIISNIDTGICIIDDEGKIQMINKQFKEALDIPRSHLVGTLLKEAVPELDGIAKRSQDQRSPFFLVCRGKEEPLKLTVQEIRDHEPPETDHDPLPYGPAGPGKTGSQRGIRKETL